MYYVLFYDFYWAFMIPDVSYYEILFKRTLNLEFELKNGMQLTFLNIKIISSDEILSSKLFENIS